MFVHGPLLLLLSATLLAQEPAAPPAPPPAPKTIAIVVRDKHGDPVATVGKADLQVVVDSKPVALTALDPVGTEPETLAFLVDTSHREEKMVPAEKPLDEAFLTQQLAHKGSKAAVLHFDKQIELMQDLSADGGALHSAINELQVAEAAAESDTEEDRSDEDAPAKAKPRESRLFDAIFLASDEVLRGSTGRRVMVVVSDGVDRGSKESLSSAVESAQRTGTVVYSVFIAGEQDRQNQRQQNGNQNGGQQQRRSGGGIGWPSSGGGGGWPGGGQGGGQQGGGQQGGGRQGGNKKGRTPDVDGKKILAELSRKTGGMMVEAKRKEDIGDALASINRALQGGLRLTFQPDPAGTGDFHRIGVVPTEKGQTVLAPEAYYSNR